MSNVHPTPQRPKPQSLSARHRASQVTTTQALGAEALVIRHDAAVDTLVHILETYYALKAQAREERVIQW